MSKIRIHTRSFHPGKTFGSTGLGFSGDDRGFSNAPIGITSRIRHYFDIDLAGARLIDSRPVSDPSHNEWMGTTQRYSDPEKQPTSTISGSVLPYRADGDQRFEATITYRGKNYAFPGADWEQNISGTGLSISPRHGIRRTVPDLDVTHTVSGHIDRTSLKLHITHRFSCAVMSASALQQYNSSAIVCSPWAGRSWKRTFPARIHSNPRCWPIQLWTMPVTAVRSTCWPAGAREICRGRFGT
jgi:hypothetical protein